MEVELMLNSEVAASRQLAAAAGEPLYLRADVKLEPLLCGWYVWSHMLSPVQAAMNLAFRYLPLLESFVANPQTHVAASGDPKLFGGPFVHLLPADIPQVRELLAATRSRLHRLLQLAQDVRSLNAALQSGSKGFSLNEVYGKVPASLAGMIELMYDINHHPRIHLLEEFLYEEYGPDLHEGVQEIVLSRVLDEERRFFMSTPRLKSPDDLAIRTHFANPALDILAKMRLSPAPLAHLREQLGLAPLANCYQHLFTAEGPRRLTPDYAGEGVRVRYFGHACVLVQTSRTAVLIDPMFASGPRQPDFASSCVRLTAVDLPDRIDWVVLSHCHQDHFCPEMLLQIRGRVGKIVIPTHNRGSLVDPSMRLMLNQLGFFDIVSLGHFDAMDLDGGRLVSIPFAGEHSDLEIYSKHSIHLELEGRRLLFLVDSDGWDVELYRRIARRTARSAADNIDALFLGMECHGAPLSWLYGPLLGRPVIRRDDESRRLSGSNCERARNVIQQFKCSRVYVYAMGQEPWLRYLMGLEYTPDSIQLRESDSLVEHCRAAGMVSARLYGGKDIIV